MATINNTLSQTGKTPGLVPISPFLQGSPLKTAGSTSVPTGGSTSQGSFAGIPFGNTQTTTAVPSSINLSSLAQNSQAPASQSGISNNSGGTSGIMPPPSNGLAPNGMEYGPTGGLQPLSSGSTNNSNPYTAQSPTFPGLVGSLATTASQPSQAFLDAQKQAEAANEGLKQSRMNEAGSLADNASNPIPIEFQQGRGQILQNQYLGQQNALTGQYQGAVGLEQAATGQQGVQQNGLNQAGSLAQPQQAGPTNLPFNPTTGQYGTPAAGAYGGANGLQAVGNIAGQIGVGQNVASLNSSLGGAQVVGNNLNDLITENNINPTGLTYANGALQFGAGAMSNPAYQKFAGQINDFIDSLAPILGAGGNVTDMKTQMSSQVVNALQSGSTIKDVVSYFLDQAKQKVQGLQQGGGINTGNPNGLQPGSGGGTTFGNFFG